MSNVRGPLLSETPQTPILMGGVYNAIPPAPQDGQGCAFQVDNEGNLLVNVSVGGGGVAPTAAAIAAAIVANPPTTFGGAVIGTVTAKIEGNTGALIDAATGAAVPANALYEGKRGTTALPTAVTDGQMVGSMADKFGRQAVVLQGDRALTTPFTYQSTAASPATMLASGGTGVFTDITELILTNESATATIVSISDGTLTYKFALAANGGLTKTFATPLKATSAATAWTVSNSAAVNVDCVGVVINNK